MSLQNTPAAERVHIAFFGVRNVGKSSVVNAVTGQDLSIVSDVKGTTTDPVKKTMELLPIGPVVIIDTPGIDDTGMLGEERVRRTKRILNQTDIAVLVVSAADGLQEADRELIALFEDKKIPYLVCRNKIDLINNPACRTNETDVANKTKEANTTHAANQANMDSSAQKGPGVKDYDSLPIINVSAVEGIGIYELKEALGKLAKETENNRPLVSDLVKRGDTVILVVPIDKAAPKGRLILPQQMVLRDLLDAGAIPVVVRDTEYAELLSHLYTHTRSHPDTDTDSEASPESPNSCSQTHDSTANPLRPVLVITDSQAFGKISAATPADIPLTSFSMVMARYKGNLRQAVQGAKAIRELQDGDTVLISEGCTHHRQCEDIGTVKFPKWLEGFTGKKLNYEFTSGNGFPDDLSPYKLVIHCGACMLNEREMRSRTKQAEDENVPMTNYGVAIAEIHGILDRCVSPLL